MALVVFLRGVNVGGHKKFSPSALARALSCDAVNLGAAGTLVVRGKISVAALRAEIVKNLPFEAELMICPGHELAALARPDGEGKPFLSILAKRPRALPPLPLDQPAGAKWQVRLLAVEGRYALSLHRRMPGTLVYPNEVVEKRLGVSATTRTWNTLDAVITCLRT